MSFKVPDLPVSKQNAGDAIDNTVVKAEDDTEAITYQQTGSDQSQCDARSVRSLREADGVDWATLKKTELHEQQDPLQNPIDDRFMRQRLQRDSSRSSQFLEDASNGSQSRRASLQQIRRSVVDSATTESTTFASQRQSSIRGHTRKESKEILLTDLELWTALVSDYAQTAVRLPTLTSRKIRAGIPQPLRGLVWQAMSGARDTHLEGLYDTLSVESTPFEKVIGRDLARTFPQVEMFKEEGGAGQLDLGKVLRAFSLYDAEVGYCQGLGFIVAPLLMNMAHSEAFCVLVRMMEGYDLRAMFTQTLSGLKLRLFQFEKVLDQVAPGISTHLKSLDVFPAMYVSQWFLSLFAVTCPLDTLHRIYDLLLAEGAPETMMRLAITLLVKNQEEIMQMEMEEVLHLLLSTDLWAGYQGQDDLLINDVVSFSCSISGEYLAELQKQFETSTDLEKPNSQVKSLQSITSSFLGRINPTRLFSGSFNTLSVSSPEQSSDMARTSSKVSHSSLQSSNTENPEDSSNSSFSRSSMVSMKKHTDTLERENKQLNRQIEDLIDALGEAHRETASLKESNDKYMLSLDEIRATSSKVVQSMKCLPDLYSEINNDYSVNLVEPLRLRNELETILLREPLSFAAQISIEKIAFLESQLDDRNHEVGRMRLSLQSVKAALEATQKEKGRVEKALSDMKQKKTSGQSFSDAGMRELRLSRPTPGRTPSQSKLDASVQSGPSKIFRRSSAISASGSATTSPVLPTLSDLSLVGESSVPSPNMTPHEEELDALRLELVQAKAAIAIAQQEAEEAKYALRMSRNAHSMGHAKRMSVTRAETAPVPATHEPHTAAAVTTPPVTPAPTSATSSTSGGWFWKR